MERYIVAAKAAGSPQDQLANFLRAGYVAQPKQLAFHALCRKCDEPDGPTEIAFGGARGPGKSHALLAQMALDDCQRRDGLKCLLLRRVGKAVRESFEDLRLKVLRQTQHEYNRSNQVVKFPNGSRIILGHFKDERDIDNYLGLEYDLIGVEEATTLILGKYKAIRTCNRTSRRDWKPRIYLNANPGGVGHAWFKKRFITELGQPRFVAATYRDNAFLNASYEEMLNDLTGWQKLAWRDGDWDVLAGQYFSNFRPNIHVIEPFKMLHSEYRWLLSIDYGWQHPTVALLLALDNGGNLYVIGEYGAQKRLPEWHSKEIKALLARSGVQRSWLYETVIGSDAYRSRSDGKCAAEEYEQLGWDVTAAAMARIDSATEILRRLGDPDPAPGCSAIEPTLYIFETCPKTIEQISSMQHDKRRPEDVLKVNIDEEGEGGDDYYDALRYGVMAARVQAVEVGPALAWKRR